MTSPVTDARGSSFKSETLRLSAPLEFLLAEHISRIDQALAQVGAYGEVRLIVDRGRLRFIQTLRSEDLNDVQR